jgi:hypothetical protein
MSTLQPQQRDQIRWSIALGIVGLFAQLVK